MDDLDSWLCQIIEVSNSFGISFANQDHERSSIDDALMRQLVPVARYKSILLQPLRISIDRKYRDLCLNALEYLIGDCFRTGKGRSKGYVFAVLPFPLCRKPWKDRFLERLLHNREAVESNVDAAAFS